MLKLSTGYVGTSYGYSFIWDNYVETIQSYAHDLARTAAYSTAEFSSHLCDVVLKLSSLVNGWGRHQKEGALLETTMEGETKNNIFNK